jgi:hypothetical protein
MLAVPPAKYRTRLHSPRNVRSGLVDCHAVWTCGQLLVTPVVDWLDNPDCMAMVFAHEAQSSLAHTLYKMKTRRARLLGLTNGI